MRVILGERLYEKANYPRYTKEQHERYVLDDCPYYTQIQAVLNIRCWRINKCYMDKATDVQKKYIEDTTRGFYNIDLDLLLNKEA